MTPSSERVPTLELRALSKRFGAVQALYNVNFDIYAGEVVGLVGDNGAGKSTLIKCVRAFIPPIAAKFGSKAGRFHPQSKRCRRPGIQTIYQDLALCDNWM